MQIPEQTDKTKWSVGRMMGKMINNDDEDFVAVDEEEQKEEEGEDKRQK